MVNHKRIWKPTTYHFVIGYSINGGEQLITDLCDTRQEADSMMAYYIARAKANKNIKDVEVVNNGNSFISKFNNGKEEVVFCKPRNY